MDTYTDRITEKNDYIHYCTEIGHIIKTHVTGMAITWTVLLTWYLDVFQDTLNYSILLHMSHMYKLMERYVSVKK